MDQNVVFLKKSLSKALEVLATEVRELVSAKGLNSLITTGIWSNTNGIIVAYLSYNSDGTAPEDSLEAVISLVLLSNQLFLESDICRTNGEIVSTLCKCAIPLDTLGSSLIEVDELCKNACKKVLLFFVREIYHSNPISFIITYVTILSEMENTPLFSSRKPPEGGTTSIHNRCRTASSF